MSAPSKSQISGVPRVRAKSKGCPGLLCAPLPTGSHHLSYGPMMLTYILEADGLREGLDGWVIGLES